MLTNVSRRYLGLESKLVSNPVRLSISVAVEALPNLSAICVVFLARMHLTPELIGAHCLESDEPGEEHGEGGDGHESGRRHRYKDKSAGEGGHDEPGDAHGARGAHPEGVEPQNI